MSETNALLLELQNAEGCPFLSDLHTSGYINRWSRLLIRTIPLDKYSLQEWNEAASYIAGYVCSFRSAEEARESILAKE